MNSWDVVIVGAGPTGLVAAALFEKIGLRVALFDSETSGVNEPRAVHFDDEIMRIFHLAGVGLEIEEISRPIFGMQIKNIQNDILMNFSREGAGENGFNRAYSFDQPELEAILRRHVRQCKNVSFYEGFKLVSIVDKSIEEDLGDSLYHPIVLNFEIKSEHNNGNEQFLAKYLLACDGAKSFVRQHFEIALTDFGMHDKWMVVDANLSEEVEIFNGVLQVCDELSPSTYVRTGAQRHRWEFMLKSTDVVKELIEDAEIRKRLESWIGLKSAQGVHIRRKAVYQFHALVAERFRKANVFLLGDAAHQTPPFIGQGMGAGIRDALNIYWKIAIVLNEKSKISILDSFEVERKRHVTLTIKRALLLGKIMKLKDWPLLKWTKLRDVILIIVNKIEVIKKILEKNTCPKLKGGNLIFGSHKLSGSVLPRFVLDIEGEGEFFLDNWALGGINLIEKSCSNEQGTVWPQKWGKCLKIRSELATHSILWKWMKLNGIEAFVLRPDFVVLEAGQGKDVNRWVKRIAEFLD